MGGRLYSIVEVLDGASCFLLFTFLLLALIDLAFFDPDHLLLRLFKKILICATDRFHGDQMLVGRI